MKIVKSSDVDKKPVEMDGAKDVDIRLLISGDDGAENFAMRMFELQPGGNTPLHIHPHEHEVFILQGNGVFICEDMEYTLEPEHVIFVPGGKEHQFKNTGDAVFKFLCIIPTKGALI